jgi:TolB-like protein/Tfp pilus assembly protein PilF
MGSFFRRAFFKLKERKVFRTLIIYLGGAWVVIQVIALFIDRYNLTGFIFDVLMILIVTGIPGSVIIAWFHGESGAQKVTKLEITLHTILLSLAILATVFYYNIKMSEKPPVIEHAENTIAVLPFENISGNENDEYFSDGITDDIITQLSKIEDIQVISRFSVMPFKNTELSLYEIAGKLNVNVILEGTVRRIDNQVRISAKLINVISGENIWAEVYDREMTEVFEVQSDVAKSIAKNLRIELSPAEKSRIETQPTANLDAYDYYLKGRDYYNLLKKEDNEIAIDFFKKALSQDTNYAMAYTGLADAYTQRVMRFAWPTNWLDSALVAGEKAILLDPELAEGYKAVAMSYALKGWDSKAIDANLLAIDRNPNYFQAINNLGVLYGRLGLIDKQIPLLEKAIALAPRFALSYVQLGEAYSNIGFDEEGISLINKAISIQPDFAEPYFSLSRLYLRQGEFTKAYEIATKGLSISPNDPGLQAKMGQIELFKGEYNNAEPYLEEVYDLNLGITTLMDPIDLSPSYLGYVYLKTDKPTVASALFVQIETTIKQAIENGNEFYVTKVELGRAAAINGHTDEAIKWLTTAVEEGWFDYRMAEIDPTFDLIEKNRAFKNLLIEMKDHVYEMRKNVLNENALVK